MYFLTLKQEFEFYHKPNLKKLYAIYKALDERNKKLVFFFQENYS